MFKLNESVRLIVIQFSFSNPKAVPLFALRLRKREQPLESALRTIRRNGVPVIEPIGKVSLADLLEGLTLARYALVDSTYQVRMGGQTATGTYSMVRFEFAHESCAEITPGYNNMWDDAIEGFRMMCTEAMWRVRAFDNPFYKNQEEMIGQRSLSINLESREPLVDAQKQPIMVWPKNEAGERIGGEKIPLAAVRLLQIGGGDIRIIDKEAAVPVAV